MRSGGISNVVGTQQVGPQVYFYFVFKFFSLRSACSAVSRFYKSRMSNAESCLTQGKVSNIMTEQTAGFLVYARSKRF
jgi:hypothetical protein